MSEKKDSLTIDIENSKTKEDIREDTLSILARAEEIKEVAKARWILWVEESYEKIRSKTIEALKSIWSDREAFKKELEWWEIDRDEFLEIERLFYEFLKQNKDIVFFLERWYKKEEIVWKSEEELEEIRVKERKKEIETSFPLLNENEKEDFDFNYWELVNISDQKISFEDGISSQKLLEISEDIRSLLSLRDNKKSFDEIIVKWKSWYQIWVELLKLSSGESPEDFRKFFRDELFVYLKDNPDKIWIFLDWWKDGKLWEDNIRSWLRRCEINVILPEIRKIEMSSKLDKMLEIASGIYSPKWIWVLREKLQEEVSKTWGEACSIDYIKFFLDFDRENPSYKLNDKNLTGEQISDIISLIFEAKANSSYIIVWEILNKNGILITPLELFRKPHEEITKYLWDDVTKEELETILKEYEKNKSIERASQNLSIIRDLNEQEYDDFLEKIKKNEKNNKDLMQETKNSYLERKSQEIENSYSDNHEVEEIREINWSYSLKTKDWIVVEWLSPEEKQIINPEWENYNKEALNNLVNFRKILRELNIDFIWVERSSIFKVIWGNDIWFNLVDNYIWKNELLKIFNVVLKIIDEEEEWSLSWAISKIKSKNSSDLWQKKDILWRSPIENIFIKKGVINPRNPIIRFNESLFEYYLNLE